MLGLSLAPRAHAAVGHLNAAAVPLLAAVAVCGLAQRGRPAADLEAGPARPVVLLVVDGLRADEAADRGLMPFLASRKTRTTAWVETPVPCSAAAVETWVHGRVPSAWAMVTDFWTGPSDEGGLIAAAARRGTVAVCGPTLWTGRYGAWVTPAVADATMGLRDDEVTAAAVDRLRAGGDRLLIVHLLALDAAGHRRQEVTGVLAEADAAARSLFEALPEGGALLVVSDHGRSAAGGHAGPEAAVRATPVVLCGADASLPAETTQRDTHRLLAKLLGVSPGVGDGGLPAGAYLVVGVLILATARRPPTVRTAGRGAVVGCMALATLVLVGLLWSGREWAAEGIVAVMAWAILRGPGRGFEGLGGVALAGLAFVPAVGTQWPAWAGPALATAAAAVAGWAARSPRAMGWTLAAAPLGLTLMAGQSASLSTLDTRAAFAVVDAWGVAAAAGVVLAVGAVPLVVLAGWASRGDAEESAAAAAALAAGQAAGLTLLCGLGGEAGGLAADAGLRLAAGWAVMGAALGAAVAARGVRVRAGVGKDVAS